MDAADRRQRGRTAMTITYATAEQRDAEREGSRATGRTFVERLEGMLVEVDDGHVRVDAVGSRLLLTPLEATLLAGALRRGVQHAKAQRQARPAPPPAAEPLPGF
jgi:hypothetical protein